MVTEEIKEKILKVFGYSSETEIEETFNEMNVKFPSSQSLRHTIHIEEHYIILQL